MITLLILVGIICVMAVVFTQCGDPRSFQERYVDWDSKECISHLEKVFRIGFPDLLSDIKAAKRRVSIDNNDTHFIVKFEAEPGAVTKFLETFPGEEEGGMSDWTSYDVSGDRRIYIRGWGLLRWFKKSIEHGDLGDYTCRKGSMFIYVDKSDTKKTIVYMEGAFRKKYLKVKPQID